MDFYSITKPLLHRLSPEVAHHLAIGALKYGLLPVQRLPDNPMLAQRVLGFDFLHPIGLAAGFDKNAEAVDGLFSQGFGFVEVGTVTPRPQAGNPKPRLFRLMEDEAVINRMGFNNAGLDVFVPNLARAGVRTGVLGANIGKNKDSDDAIADYVAGLRAVYPYVDYITINISSPNTPGLRNLQKREFLGAFLAALDEARAVCVRKARKYIPLMLKIAPDLSIEEKEDIAELAILHHMDALIISNTTISRPALKSAAASEQGGLSGRPLMSLSTEALRDLFRLTHGKIPLVGVGGVASAEDAYAKILAGASLVQLYSALVYQGFGLIRTIHETLPLLLKRDGFPHISSAIGARA